MLGFQRFAEGLHIVLVEFGLDHLEVVVRFEGGDEGFGSLRIRNQDQSRSVLLELRCEMIQSRVLRGDIDEATEQPTEQPTEVPTEQPTEVPTEQPTEVPTEQPTETPTEQPPETPTEQPTETPTAKPEG